MVFHGHFPGVGQFLDERGRVVSGDAGEPGVGQDRAVELDRHSQSKPRLFSGASPAITHQLVNWLRSPIASRDEARGGQPHGTWFALSALLCRSLPAAKSILLLLCQCGLEFLAQTFRCQNTHFGDLGPSLPQLLKELEVFENRA